MAPTSPSDHPSRQRFKIPVWALAGIVFFSAIGAGIAGATTISALLFPENASGTAETTRPASGVSPTPEAFPTLRPTPTYQQGPTPIIRIGTGSIAAMAYSPDGTKLAGATSSGITVFDALTFDRVWTAPDFYGTDVAWHPDGTRIASSSQQDHSITFWDAASGLHLSDLSLGRDETIDGIAYSPDGNYLAVSVEGAVRVWEITTGQWLNFVGHAAGATQPVWSPDSRQLASNTSYGRILVWDVTTKERLYVLEAHAAYGSDPAWSPDSLRLAAISNGGNAVTVWDALTGEAIMTLDILTGRVLHVGWSPHNGYLAAGSDNGLVTVWNGATGELLNTHFIGPHAAKQVLWSPSKDYLTAGSGDHIVVWDVATNQIVAELHGPGYLLSDLAWSPDGSQLIAASDEGGLSIWDPTTGDRLRSMVTSRLRGVEWSPDGLYLAGLSDVYGDATVMVWDSVTGQPRTGLEFTSGVSIGSPAWSPDSTRLAASINSNNVAVWNAATGELLFTGQGHRIDDYNLVNRVAWSPDGTRLAAGTTYQGILFWDAATGRYLKSLAEDIPWQNLVWSPDGSRLAGTGGSKVTVVDSETGHIISRLAEYMDTVQSLAWSPDGSRIAIGAGPYYSGQIGIWDVSAGQSLVTLNGPSSTSVMSVTWSPDGRYLAAGSSDGVILIWSAEQVRE